MSQKRGQRYVCAPKDPRRRSRETWCGRVRRLDRLAVPPVEPTCPACAEGLARDAIERLEPPAVDLEEDDRAAETRWIATGGP